MRKTLIIGAVAALLLSSVAVAADSNLFFDIRGTGVTSANAGTYQTLWLQPQYTTTNLHTSNYLKNSWPANNDGDLNASTADLYLYMIVNDDPPGTGDIISSLGLDFFVAPPTAPLRNSITSLSFVWNASYFSASGTAAGSYVAPNLTGTKAVRVPVNATPAYDTAGGLVPSATPYKVGTLKVAANPRFCPLDPTGPGYRDGSTYQVRMGINSLLITRCFQTGGDGVEMVSFGYTGGVANTAVSGNTTGQVNDEGPDATIIVLNKFDSNGDGRANSTDLPAFVAARDAATKTQVQLATFDCNGDGLINSTDLPAFTACRDSVCP